MNLVKTSLIRGIRMKNIVYLKVPIRIEFKFVNPYGIDVQPQGLIKKEFQLLTRVK
ncbi:hypothetical protein AXF42_Ash014934 [Apostasia shenzhenica]|uniref:Uncharacterized protein n=1 Tax=Apostasia shenzhenica TaxID=1088818 RepID=A0A2I0ALJ6_9ASPA|nr:hypothetical protein AXF42_Ash014934 [Apostasia shenzhenica]